eukprot:24340-Chlamydomonas_euryale.AAC.1
MDAISSLTATRTNVGASVRARAVDVSRIHRVQVWSLGVWKCGRSLCRACSNKELRHVQGRSSESVEVRTTFGVLVNALFFVPACPVATGPSTRNPRNPKQRIHTRCIHPAAKRG